MIFKQLNANPSLGKLFKHKININGHVYKLK